MPSPLVYATQGTRVLFSSLKNRFAPKKYVGTANDICKQVVEDCWNGTFFMTSPNNFPQFWTRDFGWCVQSLLKLKYDQEVQATLRYALNRFKKYNALFHRFKPRPFLRNESGEVKKMFAMGFQFHREFDSAVTFFQKISQNFEFSFILSNGFDEKTEFLAPEMVDVI